MHLEGHRTASYSLNRRLTQWLVLLNQRRDRYRLRCAPNGQSHWAYLGRMTTWSVQRERCWSVQCSQCTMDGRCNERMEANHHEIAALSLCWYCQCCNCRMRRWHCNYSMSVAVHSRSHAKVDEWISTFQLICSTSSLTLSMSDYRCHLLLFSTS